jgi:hypothetical protein
MVAGLEREHGKTLPPDLSARKDVMMLELPA